jgi:WD40 repeat protein
LTRATGRETRDAALSDAGDGPDFDMSSLGFTADGRVLVAAEANQRLRLWEAGSKARPLDLGPFTEQTTYVNFSPDARLVSASADGQSLKIYETATGREVAALKIADAGLLEYSGGVSVGFSHDGRTLATGGLGAQPALWETTTGRQLRTLTGRANLAFGVAFSADGARLQSGGRTVWELTTGRGLRVNVPDAERELTLPSPDGRTVAVYSLRKNTVRLVEAATGRATHTLAPAGRGVVNRAQFSPDGKLLVTTYIPEQGRQDAPDDDKASREALKRMGPDALKRAQKNPAELAKIFNEALAAQRSGGLESQIKVWDVATGKELRTLPASDFGTPQVFFSGDGRRLVSLGMNEATLWDVATGAQVYKTGPPAAGPSGIAGLMSGQGGFDPAQMMAGVAAAMASMSSGAGGRTVTSGTFSPDGRLLALGNVETRTDFDAAGLMRAAMSGRGAQQADMEKLMMDAMRKAKSTTKAKITLLDAATGKAVGVLEGENKSFGVLAFSRDGRTLAAAGADNRITVWDVEARRELRRLAGHGGIESMAFDPEARLLATAGYDGGTLLWDLKTGEHLATLISLYDGADWLVVTPDGLFDGSPRSWDQILWRFSRNTFDVAPVETFFNEFFYPGLLADLAAGKRPKAPRDISQLDRRQAELTLDVGGAAGAPVTTRALAVKINVTNAPAGAKDVRLFRNGSLVKVWRGDVLKGQTGATLEASVPVVAGENRLTAYAFNRDNVKSADATANVRGAESLRRAGTAYVLAIGVNSYANPQYNLKYAVADARSVAEELRRRQAALSLYERVEVVHLLDAQATKANILAALRRLAGSSEAPPAGAEQALAGLRPAQPEDAVIIFFAGHGTAQGSRFYLIPHDLGYTGDRKAIDEAGLKSMLAHSVSDEELESAVEGLDAGQLLLIIDACNSGQALEAEEKRRGPMNSKGLAQLAYEKGMYVLTAAQSYQAALEAAQLGHGLLTYALVEEGLKSEAADTEPKDGTLVAKEWFDFATGRVPEMQLEKMRQARGLGLNLNFIADADTAPGPEAVQRPRAFYRRESESNAMVVARTK